MENEQTNTPDTQGKEADKPSEEAKPSEDDKPTSLYDKTEAIVARQEAANKEAKEILERQEKLHANQRLAGTAGGHVEPKKPEKLTDEQYAEAYKKGEVDPFKEDGYV